MDDEIYQIQRKIRNIQDCIYSDAHTNFTGNYTPHRTLPRQNKLLSAVKTGMNFDSPTRMNTNANYRNLNNSSSTRNNMNLQRTVNTGRNSDYISSPTQMNNNANSNTNANTSSTESYPYNNLPSQPNYWNNNNSSTSNSILAPTSADLSTHEVNTALSSDLIANINFSGENLLNPQDDNNSD